MTALEGLLDGHAAARRPDQVTAALAEATAGRALGSALGTAVLPLVVAGAGLGVGADGDHGVPGGRGVGADAAPPSHRRVSGDELRSARWPP